jgi:mRNA interferase RelE/StbE
MTYKILYHPHIADDIRNIPENFKRTTRAAIEQRLLIDPIKAGRPLRQSLTGHRKMRVGDYRIIYRIDKDSIIVLIIGNRKDVYKEAPSRKKVNP